MTDAEILDIRDRHLPSQGEPFDTLAFGRAIAQHAELWEYKRQRDRCASAAWIHYMDMCKARNLAPSEHEHWNAARAVREA